MITVANYLEKKDTIDWSKVPSAIKAAREDVELDFDLYEDAVDVKKLIDLYITGINESQAITSTEKLKQTIEKDFGKSDNIVFVAPQKEEVGSFNLIAYAKFKGDKKFGAMDMSEGRQVGNLMYATLIPIASKQKAINILNKSKEAGEIEEFELRIGGTNKVEYSSLKSAKSQSQSKDLYIVKDGKVLTNHGMKDYSFTDNPEFAHRFEDIDFAKRMAKNYDAKIVDGFELMKSEIENYVKSSTKASAPAKIKPIKPTIAKNFVDNFSIEFQLIRRFWNIVDDGVKDVPFRKVQLLFNAFNKAALERKIRKTNDVADLFTKCSKYITRLYNEFAAPKKSDVDVELTDKTLYEEIKKYCTNVAVNPAVSVLKRYISVQNTKPDVKKVAIIIKAIDKVLTNDTNNRLAKELRSAKENLQEYIDNPTDWIDVEQFGLSRPATQKVCHNRVKCTGLTKDGKLRPGYKFREDTNEVIRVSKAKAPAKKKAPLKKKRVAGLGYSDDNVFVERIYGNQPTFVPIVPENVPIQLEKTQPINNFSNQLAAPEETNEKPVVKNKLMQMQFDSLDMDQGWENFMQDPAKNMRIAIWGKPKNGKTAGSLQFANYLTKFGNVLYNFVDQGFNKSTQDLWLSSGLANNNKAVPTDLQTLDELEKEIKTGKYTFVFIDMISDYINKEGIKPYEFKEKFIKKYPKVSFILIFEVTKTGDFKGDQGWTHIVDAIVNVEDFVMENRGRYGIGHHIVWEDGLKKFNPKKYAEIMEDYTPANFDEIEQI